MGEAHTVGLAAKDGPAMIAMQRIGKNFNEFNSDSTAMVVLEGDQPLGDAAHHYYDGLVKKLTADTEHVEHVADFWGDKLTAAGSQSNDGKAAYVQIYLRGNQGETLANDSVAAVRDAVAQSSPPPGLRVRHRRRAAGVRSAPRRRQEHRPGHRDHPRRHRADAPDRLPVRGHHDPGHGDGLHGARRRRRAVAFLANAEIIGLSTFAVNLLTLMVIAAGTDYAIFAIGRYQEARGDGEDRETRTTPCSPAPRTWCWGPA